VSFRRDLVLIAVAVFAASGDVCLARGMRDFGAVTLANAGGLLTALLNPWIIVGILLPICFFASYLTALSWADLTYVLPATAISYVMMALLAQQILHEHVTTRRWFGIALVTLGVGFVAVGPSRTTRPDTGSSYRREELSTSVTGVEQWAQSQPGAASRRSWSQPPPAMFCKRQPCARSAIWVRFVRLTVWVKWYGVLFRTRASWSGWSSWRWDSSVYWSRFREPTSA
jgi:uncharacterized membrane protein